MYTQNLDQMSMYKSIKIPFYVMAYIQHFKEVQLRVR